jgi:beta-galactosidase GanA
MKKLLIAAFTTISVYSHAQQKLPHLVSAGNGVQFMVNDRPFLILGGETGNSSTSGVAYMRSMWPTLRQMNLNTVLAPVYWELIEPEEGKFNFMLVDSLLAQARQNQMKLVLLWFGSWKNSMSCYAPAWVKKDTARFERAKTQKGERLEILSAFSKNNLQADIKAYETLLRYLKKVDGVQNTVIMIQVENEIGMLGDAREHTAKANQTFYEPVPQKLVSFLKNNTETVLPELKAVWASSQYSTDENWQKIFGDSLLTDEIFQAWHYANYANQVAAAGKKIYNLPVFVNAALNHRNVKPGQYPSAGPLPHIMDIWKAAAPDIDLFSPDFYNPNFKYYCDLYTRNRNALFIPEIHFDSTVAAKALYSVGHYHNAGFSPFSIENPTNNNGKQLGEAYRILNQLHPHLTKAHQEKKLVEGVLLDKNNPVQEIIMGDYILTVSHEFGLGWSAGSKEPVWPVIGGIIIQTGKDSFIFGGTGMEIRFKHINPASVAGILQADEGEFKNGKWVPLRRMNGDQTHQGRHVRIAANDWSIQQVTLYSY